MNRHERRRARKFAPDEWLDKMQELQDVAIVSGDIWALHLSFRPLHQNSDAEVLAAFKYWAHHVPINRPVCLTCRHEWLTWWDGLYQPPAALVILAPWNHTESIKIICAICDACVERPHLSDEIENSIRRLVPDAVFPQPVAV